jgi:hypothetical protein
LLGDEPHRALLELFGKLFSFFHRASIISVEVEAQKSLISLSTFWGKVHLRRDFKSFATGFTGLARPVLLLTLAVVKALPRVKRFLAIVRPEADWPNGWEGGYVHGRSAYQLLKPKQINKSIDK